MTQLFKCTRIVVSSHTSGATVNTA